MKVYFTAAIHQRDKYIKEYKAIESAITSTGNQLLEAYDVLNQPLEKALNDTQANLDKFYKHWWKITSEADIAVAEVTFPSSVLIGLEIASLMERAKPVICLHKTEKNPTFLSELHSQRIIKCEYAIDTVFESINWGLYEAEQMLTRRFTMNLPANIDMFLDQQAKKTRVSRSEFIRSLIEKEMEKS